MVKLKLSDKVINVVLLLPAIAWSLNGIIDLLKNGLYGYTFLLPFSFKIHTITLLSITTFYMTTFLIIKPHKPVKNFLISSLFIFLSMAIYEFVYFIFMINIPTLTLPPQPLRLPAQPPSPLPFPLSLILDILVGPRSILGVLLGIVLLSFLNLQFHFLITNKRNIFLFLMCLSCFIVIMLVLNHMGFFAQMHLYLSRQTTNDPHNPLWVLSKILCVWMFFPLLDLRSNISRIEAKAQLRSIGCC